MPGTSRPATAMAVSASMPNTWGTQARRTPASATSRTASMTAPRPVPPTMTPMSMAGSARRGQGEVEAAREARALVRLQLRDQRRPGGPHHVALQPGIAGEVHLGGERGVPAGLQPDVD